MQFQDAWLEIRSCEHKPEKEMEHETVISIQALKEVMKVAEDTLTDMQRKGGAAMWDYSRRLDAAEVDEVMQVFAGVEAKDGGRAVSYSIDIIYGGKWYALSLVGYKAE
jgi:hypothetical protein